jgi:hypothetical protein
MRALLVGLVFIAACPRPPVVAPAPAPEPAPAPRADLVVTSTEPAPPLGADVSRPVSVAITDPRGAPVPGCHVELNLCLCDVRPTRWITVGQGMSDAAGLVELSARPAAYMLFVTCFERGGQVIQDMVVPDQARVRLTFVYPD